MRMCARTCVKVLGSLFLRKFSSLCNTNAVSNICAAPHALMQTNIVFHLRLQSTLGTLCTLTHVWDVLTAGSGCRIRSLRGPGLAKPRLLSYAPPLRRCGSARLKRTRSTAGDRFPPRKVNASRLLTLKSLYEYLFSHEKHLPF